MGFRFFLKPIFEQKSTMTSPIKIGFLQPYSSLYPYYAEHLLTGFFLGFDRDPFRQNDIQFIPYFTESGSGTKCAEGIKKLIHIDKVDMISGLISYAALPEILPLLESYNKLGFFFDMGENIPHFDYLGDHAFFSSNQLWQSEFALGKWASKQFGSPIGMIMPMYEAGYHLHSSFNQGVSMGSGGNILLKVIDSTKMNPHLVLPAPAIAEMKTGNPSVVHALFSGPSALQFLNDWHQAGLNKEIPLIVNENMVYDEWLSDVRHLGLELFTASTYDPRNESKENKRFVQKFRAIAGQDTNMYALLGYEGGLVFKELFSFLQKKDFDKVKSLLKTEKVRGPRGERNFYPESGFSIPEIDVLKVKTSNTSIDRLVVESGKGLLYNESIFKDIREATPSGWKNPYMCI